MAFIRHLLQKGLLLEFKKDSNTKLLAVAQRPDGRKKWMVSDQNGVSYSIKTHHVTYIVPGIENFDEGNIAEFAERAEDKLDPTLLELAWMQLLNHNNSVTEQELALMLFGGSEGLERYSAHLLLSRDEVLFKKLNTENPHSIYEPRSNEQVEELKRRKLEKEAAEKELQIFVELLNSAKSKPSEDKPSKSSWMIEGKIRSRIESLEAYGIKSSKADKETKTTATQILKAMGLEEKAISAVILLIDIGYFPVHVNIHLLKLGVPTYYSEEIRKAATILQSNSSDRDEIIRKDFTHLKAYAIDVDEASELDDALSVTRLKNGRIKVWIHVADPTIYLRPGSIMDREAMRRWTSIFLATATYPMFPNELAMGGMSMKQGETCKAVTVSVVLHNDGSIAEFSVDNSVIKLTYTLTYEKASELLHLNLEEKDELRILYEAATLRWNWRHQQGANNQDTIESRVKVPNPEDEEPSINIYVDDQLSPANKLVSEMMILCGEAIAMFGSQNKIPLPYRGQSTSSEDLSKFSHLPEGPVRRFAMIRKMNAAKIDYEQPAPHASLGLPSYVQFTSPIRRYLDLLAHYQVKAVLRGESPPFSAGELKDIAIEVKGDDKAKAVKKLTKSSTRYWIQEYLRRQPKENTYHALILSKIKDHLATVLLVEVGLEASAQVSSGTRRGNEIEVEVEEVNPRKDVLYLKEIVKG